MQIVIHHLTRMQPGLMCVAGIDLATQRHIRPVLDHPMRTEMLAVHGGPFALRAIVDLGPTEFVGRVPEIEDQRFDAAQARACGATPEAEFQALLQSLACDSLRAIFGPELQPMGSATMGVPEARGLRSLGVYWARRPELVMQPGAHRPRIRFLFDHEDRRLNVAVTDVHLYAADHVTPDEAAVARLQQRLANLDQVLVSIGLSRPYRPNDDTPSAHWLQINNIH